MHDKSRFVFSETFNNSNGKTSGSGFIGVILGLAAATGVIAGIFGFFFEITLVIDFLEKMIQVAGISGILLGVRKAAGALGRNGNGEATSKPGVNVTPEKG